MNAQKANLINRLASEIQWAKDHGEPVDQRSWDGEIGILLSREEAEVVLALLQGGTP